jgi:hypothetical protein
MGNYICRNRFWYYRALYDEYLLREFKYSLLIASFLWLPHYFWGIHMNRELEVFESHCAYFDKYFNPRNRLTHSLIFEEFEMNLEKFKEIKQKFPYVEENTEVVEFIKQHNQ